MIIMVVVVVVVGKASSANVWYLDMRHYYDELMESVKCGCGESEEDT
jgi:hypothetical protein